MRVASSTLARCVRQVLQGASRTYPLLSGYGTLANSRLFQWAAREDALLVARLRDGSSIYVHVNDYVGRAVFYFGDLDPKISWLCRATLRPGDLVVDIGGNYGVVALQAARLVGPDGRVHVFEPQLDLADLIRRSAALNGYGQIAVHAFGLSDRDAEMPLTIPAHNRGMATFASSGAEGRRISATLKLASAALEGLGGGRPRLVKIDVEGHESEVFAGAGDWISRAKPEVIVFEHNDPDRTVWQMPGIKSLLAEKYRFYGIPKAKVGVRLTRLAPGASTRRFHDLVAVHPTSDWVPRGT